MPDIDGWWDSLVHDRAESVLELVIRSVADDYESVETILQSVNEWNLELDSKNWPAMRALPVSRPEVINAMRELTREGYVQANILDSRKPYARAVEFREDEAERLWFLVTPKGAAAVQRLYERISRNP